MATPSDATAEDAARRGGFGPLPPGTRLESRAFSDLPGWSGDRHGEAFAAFRLSCRAIGEGNPALRNARPTPPALAAICRKALAVENPEPGRIAAFFEAYFEPVAVLPAEGRGFLTAYFEPEIEASRKRSAEFPVPVLARPDDLVTLAPGEARPPLDPNLAGARRTPEGLDPYPDRAAIWADTLAGRGLEIAWLRDETELFIAQVQGSARIRWRQGGSERLVYAGRNGLPYTSIGRILVESGEIPLSEMSLERLMAWLRADPTRGRRLMERNRSYVFFALAPNDDPARGPIGGAGVPLTAGRSIAVDRSLYPYGLPVFVRTQLPDESGTKRPDSRLMVAQDTGSAIVGPARGDFFMGSGAEAGRRAGLMREAMDFFVLVPREGRDGAL